MPPRSQCSLQGCSQARIHEVGSIRDEKAEGHTHYAFRKVPPYLNPVPVHARQQLYHALCLMTAVCRRVATTREN